MLLARSIILAFLVLALAEGFLDRGAGPPCLVMGRYEPGFLFGAWVIGLASWFHPA